jgi:NADH-quinone oxidoreductase subunit J
LQGYLFYILAATLIYFSLKVVTTKNLFHSVLSAFAVLLGTAGLFFLLNAEFLAIVQMLVYAGAVTILVLFVVMLTTAGPQYRIDWEGPASLWSFTVALLFGGMLSFIVLSIDWPMAEKASFAGYESPTHALAYLLFLDYLLPFEVASILLLTALIGAIVLARRD